MTGLLLLLVAVYTGDYLLINGELYEGVECTTSRGPGVCQLLNPQCQPVFDELRSGKQPEVVCGYRGITPIVCCPSDDSQISKTSTTSRPIWGSIGQTTSGGPVRPTSRPTIAAGSTWNYNRPTTTTNRNFWDYNRPTTTGGSYWDRTTTTSRWTTTSQRTTTTRRLVNPLANARSARRMCSEYAKSVYALVYPPTFGALQERVNVSLCAIKDKTLIVGGSNAEPKEFPHSAAIGFNRGSNRHWGCGGTLVSDRFVLSAAHCTYSTQYGYAQWVRVGDLDLYRTDDVAKPQERRIVERISHPKYKPPVHYNDIALFRLESPITFDAFVRPACLDVTGHQAVGQRVVATGWGLTEHEGESSEVLLKVILPVVSHADCNATHSGHHSLPDDIDEQTQFCAGGEINKDTCQGDSGGPLATYSTQEECMYDVIGITSFGSICGLSSGVYTRVFSYLPWLESIIWSSSSSSS
ncbi:serine protease snake-like [Phymastichus coffea]|uniref:serine protease snake-like n=1 Tax=Phymastichus coffea TaxID=108790 RepID=UPI00273B6FAB|nr:serine protease snake-like [Phymastichus coffea]